MCRPQGGGTLRRFAPRPLCQAALDSQILSRLNCPRKSLTSAKWFFRQYSFRVFSSFDSIPIIKLYAFFEGPKWFYMVTELMEGGELFDRIVIKTVYTEREARDTVKILLSILKCVVDQTSRGPRPRYP